MTKPDRKIIELMEVPKSEHDLDWLKESLQAAVKLEFFTLPLGGYRREDVSDQVWQMLQQVDQSFTDMTFQLQSAWKNGDQSKLFDAVGTMYQLKIPSKLLMQTPIPSGGGNYGPCFRLVKKP